MRDGGVTKRQAQIRHACRRFAERLPQTKETPESIGRRIRNQEALKSWRHSAYISFQLLIVDGNIELFVYDRRRQHVVTVIPAQDARVVRLRRRFRHRLMEEQHARAQRSRLAS